MKDPVTFYPGAEPNQEDAGSSGPGILRTRASRRAFIKGVIASGAVAGSATFLFGCSSDRPAAGAVERLLSLNINGRVRRVDVLPNETLAMTLRYKLGLTGTKLSCDRGDGIKGIFSIAHNDNAAGDLTLTIEVGHGAAHLRPNLY